MALLFLFLLVSCFLLSCCIAHWVTGMHLTGPHSHSGYEPVGGSSTWTDILQHTCGDKCLFALLNKMCMWYYNIWYKMHDKRTQMRNTAKCKTTLLTRLEPALDNRSSPVSLQAHRPQRWQIAVKLRGARPSRTLPLAGKEWKTQPKACLWLVRHLNTDRTWLRMLEIMTCG